MAVATPALSQTLARASRRVRIRLALRHGATGLLIGAASAGVLLALLRAPVPWRLPAGLLALPPLLGLLAGALWGMTRRVRALDVARLTEQRLDLKERLSTAVALAPLRAAADNPLLARQIADAEAHAARGLDLRAALPLRLPRRGWAALATLLAVFFLWFLPTLPFFQTPRERAERAAVRREGERLVRVARALETEAAAKKLDRTRQAAEELAALGREMRGGNLDRQKALMKVAKMTRQLQQSQQALAAANGSKSLPAAGRELQKALQAAGAAAASSRQAMGRARQALQNADTPSLAEQLSRLAQQARDGRPRAEAGRDELGRQLSGLAEALKGTSLETASAPLAQAARSIKGGDMPQAARQLQQATRQAAESARRSEDGAAMQRLANALAGEQAGSAGEPPGDPAGGNNPGAAAGAPSNERFGAGPQAGQGRAGFRVTQGGPQQGPRRQDPGFKAPRGDRHARLYAPGGKTPDTRVTGKRGPRGNEALSYFRDAPDQAEASVPYYDVYGRYAPAAESALSREDIPATYKKQVKDYFDSLRPGAGSQGGK